jgi:crotonobetainyl-CoA:carnitine CoA-transferase CaiB-like acyl-CoA transferase
LTWAGPAVDGDLAAGDDPAGGFPGYGTFLCADGALTLGVVSEQPFWVALCEVLQLSGLAGLSTADRVARGPELRARIASALEGLERDRAVTDLVAAGVPVAPVLSADEAVRADVFVQRGVSGPAPGGAFVLDHPVRFTPWESGKVSDRSQ